MAKNKKSFVLYADLIHTVRKMPLEKAGELFMVILSYVNDENPVIEDMVVDLVFEPIKHQMKRDLVKYEEKKEKWSKAGKESAKSKQLSKEKQHSSTESTNVNKRSKRSTESTVTVNATVTDTVIKNTANIFSAFHQAYPEKKKWITTDLKEFKKHKDWQIAIHLLLPALNAQIKFRETQQWNPPWKHLTTWLRERCWEETITIPEKSEKKLTKDDLIMTPERIKELGLPYF